MHRQDPEKGIQVSAPHLGPGLGIILLCANSLVCGLAEWVATTQGGPGSGMAVQDHLSVRE